MCPILRMGNQSLERSQSYAEDLPTLPLCQAFSVLIVHVKSWCRVVVGEAMMPQSALVSANPTRVTAA